MSDDIIQHYTRGQDVVTAISSRLQKAGRDFRSLKPTELAAVDQFHIRGRTATVEVAEQMNLQNNSRVLDIGCGLGGPARTIAELIGCRVIGVDLAEAYCDAATTLSRWVGLDHLVEFCAADATRLPFNDNEFDAAMTIHAAMNIEAKDVVYAEARRVLKPGSIFAVYDVLQGEGGEVLFPVPWARDRSISYLATPDQMADILTGAGLTLLDVQDSTAESEAWFARMTERMAYSGPPAVTFGVILGDDFDLMAANQVRNLKERRIRTVTYICRA